MDNIAGKGGTGALMAFGAHVSVPANGVHGRVEVIDAGYGLAPVALAAGEVGPDRVDVLGLIDMAVFTTQVLIKFDTPVGVP